MKNFTYAAAQDYDLAFRESKRQGSVFLAGGTTVVDLWKLGAIEMDHAVDINGLPMRGISASPSTGFKLGAAERMSDAAAHADLAKFYPVIVESLLLAASPQIRNMASLGGNLMQRPRSITYRQPDLSRVDPPSRFDAIYGVSARTAAPHPSDFAVALLALDASVRLRSVDDERLVKIDDFYRIPGNSPERLTTICPGELIVEITGPPLHWGFRSTYTKIRDRFSYQFAIVSVAGAADMDAERIHDVRLAAGGVGTRPWRLIEVENALRGKPAALESYQAAAGLVQRSAVTHHFNAYKVPLLQNTIVRTLLKLGEAA
jgi:xanthine dehydrogenase YagS FAD-binding subunit